MQTESSRRRLTIQEVEGGFPHSEILGSKLVRSSPGLIAAYHVLHRLLAPRHPPNALISLHHSHDRCPPPFAKTDEDDVIIRKTIGSGSFDPDTLAKRTRTTMRSSDRPCSPGLSPAIGYVSSLRCERSRHATERAREPFDLDETSEWWSQTGSNRRPHACKARALPTELWPRRERHGNMVGLGRLERPTSPLSGVRSNHLSYRPEKPPTKEAGSGTPRIARMSREERETKTAVSRMMGPDWPRCFQEFRYFVQLAASRETGVT